jgi:membrane protease YdiL (CAAX protease family)
MSLNNPVPSASFGGGPRVPAPTSSGSLWAAPFAAVTVDHREGIAVAVTQVAQDHAGPQWVRTDQVGPDRANLVEQLSAPKLIALHLVPGALVTVAFVLFAPLVKAAGFPPIAALLAAIMLVLVPVELGIVLRAVRRDGAAAALPYRQRLGLREWFWLIPVLIVAAFVGFGVHRLGEPWLIAHVFGWLPEWFVFPIPLGGIHDYSASSWIVTLCAFFLLNGVIGPVVEELYFRGFLLPRMERLGRWAPLVNATLFSIYHLWSPWQIVARIAGIGPMVYAVRWKRNVYLGMAVHCALNTLAVALTAGSVLSLIS